MRSGSLRALAADRPTIGTFLKLPRPEVVDIMAGLGLDFLICDTEHAQIDEGEARTVIQAGRAARIPVVVRVPALDTGQVNRLLEAGAAGIQLSGITTTAQAQELGRCTRYPPEGERGLSTVQPAAGFGAVPLAEYLSTSNEQTLRVGQLESAQYDDKLESILPELDIAFVGPMDLSVSLGVPGRTEAREVAEVISRIEEAARAAGTLLGIYANNPAEAQRAMRAGYRYVAVASDLALLRHSAREQFAALTEAARDAGG